MKQMDNVSLGGMVFPAPTNCYQIPPWQRNYQWTIDEAHRLAYDIGNAMTKKTAHWLGVALVAGASKKCDLAKTARGGHDCNEVIDGQQRLITLRLWLLAIFDEMTDRRGEAYEWDGPRIDGFEVPYTRENISDFEVHALDEGAWNKVVSGEALKMSKVQPAQKMSYVYLYFRYLLLQGTDGFGQEEVFRGGDEDQDDVPEFEYLAKKKKDGSLFSLIREETSNSTKFTEDELEGLLSTAVNNLDITILEHENHKDASVGEIFRTLNDLRKPLTQYDLFRNFTLLEVSQEGQKQKQIYDNNLAAPEKKISQERLNLKNQDHLDAFLYDVLISKGLATHTENFKASRTSAIFESQWRKRKNSALSGSDMSEYLKEELIPLMWIWHGAITGSNEIFDSIFKSDLTIPVNAKKSIWRIEGLSRNTLTPLVVLCLDSWRKEQDDDELITELFAVETFIARWVLAGERLNSVRRMVMDACAAMKNGGYEFSTWSSEHNAANLSDEYISARLMQTCADEKGEDRDPDEWLKKKEIGQLANSRFFAILDGITAHMEGEEEYSRDLVLAPGKKYTKTVALTKEHIYPENPNEDWEVSERLNNRRHAFGNMLALPMSANNKIKNLSFEDKKEELQQIDKFPDLKINEDFFTASQWTEVEIDNRTKDLAKKCLEFWKDPQKDPESEDESD